VADAATTALVITAAGTAISGGLLGIARIIEAVSNFMEARRGDGSGGNKRRELQRARRYEKQAQDIREKYSGNDDDRIVPFEQVWVTP
jgi:hypothetical protein